jgi:sporulation protein YlmC with PRC-barrel domain
MSNRSTADYPVVSALESSLASRLFMPLLRPNATLLGARDLIGDVVYDSSGEYVGKIVETMVDVRIGCVAWVVVAIGGFWGMGRKRFAIPWNLIVADVQRRRCTLTVDRQRLVSPLQVPAIERTERQPARLDTWPAQNNATAGRRPARLEG